MKIKYLKNKPKDLSKYNVLLRALDRVKFRVLDPNLEIDMDDLLDFAIACSGSKEEIVYGEISYDGVHALFIYEPIEIEISSLPRNAAIKRERN